MATVNFLPQDRVQSKQVTAMSRRLKVGAAVLGVVCLVIGIGATALVLLRTNEISSLKADQETLRSEVLAQESSEQTLVLLRDRLNKIAEVQKDFHSNDDFLAQKQIVDTLPTGSDLKQVTISNAESTFAVGATNSTTLSDVIAQVKTSPLSSALIDSLIFNTAAGYTVTFKK